MKRPQVFIEKIMPVKLLNEQVYYEHGGNPFKGLHRWYSRKPLSFSRASVLASLLPADISMEEFEYLLGLHPEKDGILVKKKEAIKLYKTPPSSLVIEKLEEYCDRIWGKRKPVVLDAFAGGGSIPFEAARYGLNVLASDLNPVAVVTMKAAMEYPLKFGADLQQDIDKWVKFVGDEAEKRLAEFFPSNVRSSENKNEEVQKKNKEYENSECKNTKHSATSATSELLNSSVQNYLWAHTVVCPHCESVVPLSPNWWLSKTSNYAGKGQERKVTSDWYAVKPIPNPEKKRVDFELIRGKKGKGTTIVVEKNKEYKNSEVTEGIKNSELLSSELLNSPEEYDPDTTTTISRGVGKCPNCTSVIEDDVIKSQAKSSGLGHQLYAVAYKKGKGGLQFRIPTDFDLDGVAKAEVYLQEKLDSFEISNIVPDVEISSGAKTDELIRYGIDRWDKLFNPRQLLTLVTYVEIINEAKSKLQVEYEPEKVEAIATYLALVFDQVMDRNCRLSHWDSATASTKVATASHALNLMWNYPEVEPQKLWYSCAKFTALDYTKLCQLFGTKSNSSSIPGLEQALASQNNSSATSELLTSELLINSSSADSLFHIPDRSVDTIVTDPPYYSTIQYAELSDFFYVWMKRTLGDIFPDLFYSELTDKDREAVANPSRFRNMGASPEELAKQDYEAKMQLAFSEYYRVLRDDGVMTVQFNHKESGAWDVLTKSLIDAGFEITASWSVSTENPQNLHQAKKNSVSSTVLLVCRKRDPNAEQAWWDDLRPEVANLVEQRAPEFEENEISGIDLYLSAFGPALNVFSRSYPILDSSGEEVRPEVAFAEARKAIANYRFRKLVQTDTAGFDPLTQWYLLAWDAFKAREFPFDEARQLALAIGGFNVNDLAKVYKLIDSASGTCKLLTPKQRHKKRAFSADANNFSNLYLVDALHAIIAIYQEEQNPQLVRKFMQNTGLNNNDMLMKTLEIAFKVLPKSAEEHKTLTSLWLSMDEIKAKVIMEQTKLF
jgi:putative DNA methylase